MHRTNDVALAAALIAWGVVEALALAVPEGRALALLGAVALPLALVWRRSHPVLVAVWILVPVAFRPFVDVWPYVGGAVVLCVPLALFGLAAYVPGARRGTWLGLLAGAAFVVARFAQDAAGVPEVDGTPALLYLFYVALTLFGVATGSALRDRTRDVERLGEEVRALEAVAAEPATADAALRLAAEMRRLASATLAPLPDMVAAARRAALAAAPDTGARVREVGTAARSALSGLRRIVGRLGEPPAGTAPPTITALAAGWRVAGATVSVRAAAARGTVAATVLAAADRVVRAALRDGGGTVALRAGRDLDIVARPERALPAGAVQVLGALVEPLGGRVRARPVRGGLAIRLPAELPSGRAAGAAPVRHLRALGLRALTAPAAPVAALAILGAAEQLLGPEPTPAHVAAAVAVPLPLLLRARYPIAAALTIAAGILGLTALGVLSSATTVQAFLVVLVAAYGVGAGTTNAVAGAAMVAAYVGAMALDPEPWPLTSYCFYAGLVGGAWIVGAVVGRRGHDAAALRAERDALLARRAELREQALTAERARLADELHDVAGHALTLVATSAGAAEAGARRDPAAAVAAIDLLAAAVDAALAELAAMARVLAERDGPAGAELAALRALAGPDADGALDGIPEAVAADVRRIVLEALTNARKHARSAPVALRFERTAPRTLVVDVHNAAGDPSGLPSGGRGLASVRTRAQRHGGDVAAGPDGAGGWRVRASVHW